MANPTRIINNPGGQLPPSQSKSKSKAWIITPIVAGGALLLGGGGVFAYSQLHNGEENAEDTNNTIDPEDKGNEITNGNGNTNENGEGTDYIDVDPEEPEEPIFDDEPQEVAEPHEEATQAYTVTFNPANVHQSMAVNDDMTFAEAFAAARHDVGAGGVFVWHGNIYGTYTANEWSAMSPEDQDAFANNFYFAPSHDSQNHLAEMPTDHIEPLDPIEPYDPLVEDPNEVALVTDDDPDLMLISQEYDPESGMTFAYVTDGDDVALLADVDNDGVYDYIASDLDGNGEISDDEISDISDYGFTQADVDLLPDYDSSDPYNDIMMG